MPVLLRKGRGLLRPRFFLAKNPRRSITASEDFAKAFLGLMGNPHAIGEAFHITSDEALTWNQIHELIAKNLGVKLNACHVASDFLAAMGKYDLTGALLW